MYVEDRELCGRNIRALYEDGWHSGGITWFNTVLGRYRVEYEDGSDDYVEDGDIDNINIILE